MFSRNFCIILFWMQFVTEVCFFFLSATIYFFQTCLDLLQAEKISPFNTISIDSFQGHPRVLFFDSVTPESCFLTECHPSLVF
jgi:hypothetical protein